MPISLTATSLGDGRTPIDPRKIVVFDDPVKGGTGEGAVLRSVAGDVLGIRMQLLFVYQPDGGFSFCAMPYNVI